LPLTNNTEECTLYRVGVRG